MMKRASKLWKFRNGVSLPPNQSTFAQFCNKNFDSNLTFSRQILSNNFHVSAVFNAKQFVDAENAYAHNIVSKFARIFPPKQVGKVAELGEFEGVLGQNWRVKSAPEIVAAFRNVEDFCVTNSIALSDPRFDRLVDGLMDNCEKLSDDELLELLDCISRFPPCESISSRNFHDVWSCLDDICCWKMTGWGPEKMFAYVDVWYRLNLGRISDYSFEVLDTCAAGRKAKRLTKDHLVYLFFCVNVCRKRCVDFEVEFATAEKIHEFSLDELGVIAMGYFKSQSKVKLEPILERMIQQVTENAATINEITLTALLKTIRLTKHFSFTSELDVMLDRLLPQIDRLSPMSCLHIALIGTGIQHKHDATLIKCSQIIAKNISTIRIKDIERILLANVMFDFDPRTTPDLYRSAFEELHKPSRRPEIAKYNRCLPCALHYLSFRKIYSYSLMNQVLDEEFINEVYGVQARMLPRELFSLDCCIEIECPDYEGYRLSPVKKYKGAKWLTDFAPEYDQYKKLTLADKFFLDTFELVKEIVGGDRCVMVDHVLPHFPRADIIVCKDKTSGSFVEPLGFENYILGDIKRPYNPEKYQWYSIMPLTPNITIRNTINPLGLIVMKARHLTAIGYNPIFVAWNQFVKEAPDRKKEFLAAQLSKF